MKFFKNGIECDNKPLRRVFREFERHIGGRFCIAGGAVRDVVHGYKPRDYDLFCFEPPDWRRLFANYHAPADQQHRYRDMTCLTLLWKVRTVQIIHRSTLTTIPALLDEFDWCICQWAYDGEEVRTIGSTQVVVPGNAMRLANPRTAETSLARGKRFAERFGMTIDPEAMYTLLARIDGSSRQKVLAKHAERIQRRLAA